MVFGFGSPPRRWHVAGWAKVKDVIPYDQAIDYITTVIRTNPSSNAYSTAHGLVWSDKEGLDIAIGDFNEAIRLDPQTRDGVLQPRHRLVPQEGARQGASPTTARRSGSIPRTPRRSPTGATSATRTITTSAIADYNEAIRLDPRYARLPTTEVSPGRRRRSYDKAIADYSEAIRLDPKVARRTTIGAGLAGKEGIRQGPRRLR